MFESKWNADERADRPWFSKIVIGQKGQIDGPFVDIFTQFLYNYPRQLVSLPMKTDDVKNITRFLCKMLN